MNLSGFYVDKPALDGFVLDLSLEEGELLASTLYWAATFGPKKQRVTEAEAVLASQISDEIEARLQALDDSVA